MKRILELNYFSLAVNVSNHAQHVLLLNGDLRSCNKKHFWISYNCSLLNAAG